MKSSAYKLSVTNEFRDNYWGVIRWLLEEYKSPQAAARLKEEINQAVANILALPFLHGISHKPFYKRRHLRECYVLNYTIVYKVVDNEIILFNLHHQLENYGMHD